MTWNLKYLYQTAWKKSVFHRQIGLFSFFEALFFRFICGWPSCAPQCSSCLCLCVHMNHSLFAVSCELTAHVCPTHSFQKSRNHKGHNFPRFYFDVSSCAHASLSYCLLFVHNVYILPGDSHDSLSRVHVELSFHMRCTHKLHTHSLPYHGIFLCVLLLILMN